MPGTRLAEIMGAGEHDEGFFCNYEANLEFMERFRAFNSLFLVYVALFSLSLWTVILVLTRVDGAEIREAVGDRHIRVEQHVAKKPAAK